MTKTFEDVIAWQKAHQFVLQVYRICKVFPDTERFGLTSQFQRAATSIAANFAEGYGKLSQADKLRFMNIAQGSMEECRYYSILDRDLTYINEDEYQQLRSALNEASFLLNSYIKGILENKFKDTLL